MRSEELLKLPGISKTKFRYKSFQDFLFFLAVVAVPSSFFALVPISIFKDLRLFFFLVSLIYLVIYLKYIIKIIKIPAGIALLILNLFLLFEVLINSLIIQNIPTGEVAAIFRANFFYPMAAFGFLLYILSMDNYRIYRFLYWLLYATVIQGSLYVFSNITGVNVFANDVNAYSFDGGVIMQNMFAIPHYNGIVFAFAFVTTLTLKKFNKHWLWFIPLVVTIISIVRSQMIMYFLVMLISIILINISNIKINFLKLLKLFLYVLIFIGMMSLVFPSHINRISNKFRFDKKEEVSQATYLEEGTFALRLRLIEDAYMRTQNNNNLLIGNGYIREASKGEYDFVVGSDTFIAPVLFTEGFMGLFFRIFPLAILLIYFIKLLLFDNPRYKLFAIIAISLILPEILNAVQTRFFAYYTRETFILFILVIIIYNDKKEIIISTNKKEII